jgi:hypothetical protein
VLLFVGRLAPNKRVPLLVEALGRLRDLRPPVHAVVVGDAADLYQAEAHRCGERAAELGVTDRLHLLGRLSEADLLHAYHAADVLVMPSVCEGFCIPVIEAMACGVPVVAAHSTALPETVADAGLTFTPDDTDDLAVQLRRLLETGPASAQQAPSLREEMRRRGLERARLFAAPAWQEQFGKIVEAVLDGPPRPCRHLVEVSRRWGARRVRVAAGSTLVAVRAHNRGTHPVTGEGPGRTVLRCRVVDRLGRQVQAPAEGTPLPGLVLPGRSLPAALAVPVSDTPGVYRVDLWAEWCGGTEGDPASGQEAPFTSSFRLMVRGTAPAEDDGRRASSLDGVDGSLRQASRLQRLPEDYVDVTEGLLASVKRRIKGKLLGNFKQAYVDVLSRQQSAFNRQVLVALQELAECCATLERAVRLLRRRTRRRSSRSGAAARASARTAPAGPRPGESGVTDPAP